jgi:hypothetical protein
MSEHSDPHSVRRITLPSGRSIEVVRFSEVEGPQPRPLHLCPACDSNLVQPVAWSEAGGGAWDLALECPNCGHLESGTFDRHQVETLEEQLDEGLAEMLDDLRRLTQVNMHEDIERFIAALEADVILPEDF